MYRILLMKTKRGFNEADSFFEYYTVPYEVKESDFPNTDIKIPIENGKFLSKKIFETSDIEELQNKVAELAKTYPINSIKPVSVLGVDNNLIIKEEELISTMNIELLINGEKVKIDFSKENIRIDIPQLQCDKPNIVELLSDRQDFKVKFHGILLTRDNPTAFKIESISKDCFIEVEYYSETSSYKAFINTYNSELADITDVGDSSEYLAKESELLFSFRNIPQIIKKDCKGKVLFYRVEGKEEDNIGLTDFKKHIIGEDTYYSFHRENRTENFITGNIMGERIVLDSNYQIVDTVKTVEGKYVKADNLIDGHDFKMIGVNHYMLISNCIEFVDNIPIENEYTKELISTPPNSKTSVVCSIIQEIKEGKLVFEFNSIDHPFLYSMAKSVLDPSSSDFLNTDTFTPNYALINCFENKENEVLISFPNCNSIISFEKNTENVNWILSDGYAYPKENTTVPNTFNMAVEDKFIGQSFFYSETKKEGEKTSEYIYVMDTSPDNEINMSGTRIISYCIDIENDSYYVSNLLSCKTSTNYGNFEYIDDVFSALINLGEGIANSGNVPLLLNTLDEGVVYSSAVEKRIIPYRTYYYKNS